jgi:uncharacterized oxidoreductase
MRMDGNTIFITGGGEGIGRGLAEAFHQLGNQVIIASRRESVLKGVCDANPGMRYYVLDVANVEQIRSVAAKAIADFPKLNCLIANAGVQRIYSFAEDAMPDDHLIAEEIEINLLGAIRTTTAFLPHLRKQESAAVIHLSSGLAYVPRSACAVYCATKAAVHSLSLTLRHQYRATNVKFIELIPPRVDTMLGGGSGNAPNTMTVADFVAEAMNGLASGADEVPVGHAKRLFAAGGGESVKAAFAGLNTY